MADKIEVRRYPLLRLISSFYKIMALGIAGGGWVVGVIAASDVIRVGETLSTASQGVVMVGLYGLGGLVVAVLPYTFSLLIDLFLDTNNNTRQLSRALEEQNHTFEATMRDHSRALQNIHKRQANPYPRERA